MNRLPIRVRLTLGFALAMAVVLAGMGLLVYVRVGGALLASVDQTLHSQAVEAAARAHEEQSLVDPDAAGGATLAQLLAADGTIVRNSRSGLAPLIDPADARAVAGGSRVLRSITLKRPEGRLAGDRRSRRVTRREWWWSRARSSRVRRRCGGCSASCSSPGRSRCCSPRSRATRSRRPRCARSRRCAAAPPPSPRPRRAGCPCRPRKDEVSRLATTLNDMLARLQGAFEHERRFVSDASHELRTPLALLRTELELALRRPRSQAELEDALRSAAEETERLSRLAEDLLLIARADQGALPIRREAVPAAEVLAPVAARFATRVAAARPARCGPRTPTR